MHEEILISNERNGNLILWNARKKELTDVIQMGSILEACET